MHAVPDLPAPHDAPALFESGHLWLSEWLPGPLLRARLDASGQIRVDGARGRIDDRDPPVDLRWPIRALRTDLDRAALREATADPSAVTLVLVAPRNEGLDYDWTALPPIVGVAIHDAARDRWLAPDAAERAFEGIGLATLPTIARERRARDFDPESIAIPDSSVRDGPAAGVLIRNKRGDHALVTDVGSGESDPLPDDPDVAAEHLVTDARLDRAIELASDRSAVADRLFELLVREEWAAIDAVVDPSDLRGALGGRVATALADRGE
ncbi:hypothetical protein [Halococcoides cellulosivorans]|uniref:Uncharacterized protein n=1 Tax=Halococcoides cellulosivorans TaxID=1679096 RepID=A0A2R4WZ75_9EURY|nr:hypothetical protein [Halococcoides cellulosivorans]AWB26840.1 hypothetical protein HARCEL1_03465 [Halococcoides cellulosivorans]